uniref:Uncharacterized protein n=1 Tax=Rhizophora mucronata TaxID=61149 RepID=A0A2P2Q9R8_RHIMU
MVPGDTSMTENSIAAHHIHFHAHTCTRI